jgi:hypothetical protein
MPIGGERRHPDQFFQGRVASKQLSLPRHLFPVVIHPWPETIPDGSCGNERNAGSDQASPRECSHDACLLAQPETDNARLTRSTP